MVRAACNLGAKTQLSIAAGRSRKEGPRIACSCADAWFVTCPHCPDPPIPPQTFRSKEISKSNVVDDMVQSNSILYG